MKVGNVPAVGIAISTVSDGNVVEMAELVANRVADLREEMPDGYNLDIIYDQGHESAVANEGFVWNLILSVLTVVAVLLFFIGFKNGILIGSGLIFSIFGTLIYMQFSGIACSVCRWQPLSLPWVCWWTMPLWCTMPHW